MLTAKLEVQGIIKFFIISYCLLPDRITNSFINGMYTVAYNIRMHNANEWKLLIFVSTTDNKLEASITN